MNPKVSVVIPVYKTEAYLEECVESVRNQEYDNFEIILVDDGSPDNCPYMCDEYAQKDSRIKVVHKVNTGLGLTRNAGVDASEGDYIVFLDSDDKLDGDMAIANLVKAALENDADLVVGSYRRFNSKMESGIKVVQLKNGEDSRTPEFRFKGFYQYNHLSYAWGKLYRKAFLVDNGLKHGSYTYAEDKAFNIRVYAYNPRYAFLEESVCCYRINEGSITFKYKKDLMDIWISIASDYIRFLKERNIKNEFGDLISFQMFFGVFFVVKQELESGKGIFETAKILKEYAKNPFIKKLMKRIIAKEYTGSIQSNGWRLMVWGSTMAFNLHMYILFVLGIAIIRKTGTEEKVSEKRYRN